MHSHRKVLSSGRIRTELWFAGSTFEKSLSLNRKASAYNPIAPGPTKLTLEEYKSVLQLFKELIEENPRLKWAITFARVGGISETAHVPWLAAVFPTPDTTISSC